MPTQITVSRSSRAANAISLLWAGLATLVLLIDYPVWLGILGALGLALAAWASWRQIGGCGRAPLQIEQLAGHWLVSWPGQAPLPLVAVRPLWVRPNLLGLQLHCAGRSVPLWVLGDAVSQRAHWQLRRLALRGIGQRSPENVA
jgi:hypothetical protein